MPQLNTTQWFSVMLISWLFLLIMMTKVLNSDHTTHPTTQSLKTVKTPLAWPWH